MKQTASEQELNEMYQAGYDAAMMQMYEFCNALADGVFPQDDTLSAFARMVGKWAVSRQAPDYEP